MSEKIPDQVKENLYDFHAKICKAMANKTRIKILDQLKENEMRVDELAKTLKTSAPNISQHLSLLKDAGIVCSRKEQRYAYYSICDKRIVKACDLVKEFMLDQLKDEKKLLNQASKFAKKF